MLRLSGSGGGGPGHAGGKAKDNILKKKKKKKKNKTTTKASLPSSSTSASSSSLLASGRRVAAVANVTDEDLLLGLMDEMGSSMLGGDTAVASPPAAPAAAEASTSSRKKGKKRARPPSSGDDNDNDDDEQDDAVASKTPASDAAGHLEDQAVSRHEVWDPTRRADMDTLNLPWWGRSVAAAAAAPRLPLPDPRTEVARFAAAKQLRAWLVAEATGAGHDGDYDPNGMSSSSITTTTKAGRAADRAFHRWLRGSKLAEQQTSAAVAAAAAGGSDPVIPSTPASGRNLALAQALTSAPLSLSAEAAVEACEQLAARAGEAASRLAAAAAATTSAAKKQAASSSSLLQRGGGAGAAVALHPLSRLDQPPVLRSRHHRPCLYLPLSAPRLGERLELLQENEALEVSLLKGHVLRMNDSHYQKLRALYTQQHVSQARPTAASSGGAAVAAMTKDEEHLFHERLGCLLFRYQALAAEGQSTTATMTSAVGHWERLERSLPPLVFDVLAAEFGVAMECFASPFNCRFARYCSAQWDVDGFFGSLGSFFRFEPLEGAFVAHPPAVPEVIDAAIKHMERLLARTARSLAFFLVVPGAKKEKEAVAAAASTKKQKHPPLSSSASVRRLLPKAAGGKGGGSPFLAWHLHLAPGSYGLVRGDQHYRLRSHMPGKEEGLLLLALQSQANRAAGRHALTPARERLLRHAFASFEAENGRDKLAPPPPDITVPVCARGGEEEWWW